MRKGAETKNSDVFDFTMWETEYVILLEQRKKFWCHMEDHKQYSVGRPRF